MSDRLPPPALLALGAVVLAAIVSAILLRPAPADIEALFAGGGALGPVLFGVSYALLTVLFLPGAPLTIASGALYGVVGGAWSASSEPPSAPPPPTGSPGGERVGPWTGLVA